MSQLTTHILDTSKGCPAEAIRVHLFQHQNGNWNLITSAITDNDGRVRELLAPGQKLDQGIYKLKFDTKEYFDKQGIPAFYPFVEIVFIIKDAEHYHVPLLLNPFGYSTYRGS